LTDEVILVIGFFAVALGLTLRGLPVWSQKIKKLATELKRLY
jgi:hypothetical protein